MMMIDPVHLFTEDGTNILTARDQASEIARLQAENVKLVRLLKLAAGQLRVLSAEQQAPDRRH